MHSYICDIIEGILTAARPDVPILIAVAFKTAIDTSQEAEAPEVKLSLVYQ